MKNFFGFGFKRRTASLHKVVLIEKKEPVKIRSIGGFIPDPWAVEKKHLKRVMGDFVI